MRVVIAGGGSVGRFIAEQLHGTGHDVTILDNDKAVIAQARRSTQVARSFHFAGELCHSIFSIATASDAINHRRSASLVAM